MSARRLNVHACFGCLDSESREHLAVGARYRDGHADNADKILLPIERDLFLSNLTKLDIEPVAVGEGAVDASPRIQPLQPPEQVRLSSQANAEFVPRVDVVDRARATRVVQV